MEDRKFDELTKRLAAPVSRRTALKAAVVTAVGSAFGLSKLAGAEAQTAPCVGPRAVACAAGQVCCTNPRTTQYGRCMICPPGRTPNSFCQCVCTNSCPSGQTLNTTNCTCSCPAGQTLCNGTCCNGTCCNGTCVTTPSCPSGQFLDQTCTCQCVGGVCPAGVACGPSGFCSVCATPGTCNTGEPSCGSCTVGGLCEFGSCSCYERVNGAPICAQDNGCDQGTCTTDADCGTGLVCVTLSCCDATGATKYCLAPCQSGQAPAHPPAKPNIPRHSYTLP